MTAPAAAEPADRAGTFVPRILVFSTNNISDPGIDLAGSAHFHYSPGVNVIALPCTSGIRPSWILHALETGFDGVFVATDGDECAYLHDCAKRSNKVVHDGPEGAQGARDGREPHPRRGDLLGLRGAVHQAHDELLGGARRHGPGEGGVDRDDRHHRHLRHRPTRRRLDYDVLVVGAGIGGMESALKLGDMGYKVLLVEKEASVGGKMILLSKVFPTLDCASCISTPKMASTIHHPNITPCTYGRVDGIRTPADGTFRATVTQKARFVDIDACTGCQKCETACTVAVPDQFNADLVARRAAHITFPQAVPKKAVIDRAGSSPCSFACPAGIQAHGYVSLIRSGLDEEAYRLVLDATPLVGTLGRACYAPCEGECTRGSLEGTLPIRRLKRFASDAHDASGAGQRRRAPGAQRQACRDRRLRPDRPDRRLAARPARLRREDPRGRSGRRRVPAPRHPVLPPARGRRRARHRERPRPRRRDRDRPTGSTTRRPSRTQGFDAVLVATGTHRSTGLGVPGEDRLGVLGGTDFLRKVKLDQPGRPWPASASSSSAAATSRWTRRGPPAAWAPRR